eukprot:1925902-Rhodomonas_salina.1
MNTYNTFRVRTAFVCWLRIVSLYVLGSLGMGFLYSPNVTMVANTNTMFTSRSVLEHSSSIPCIKGCGRGSLLAHRASCIY